VKTATTSLLFGTFCIRCVEKRRICSSLFSYHLTTNTFSLVDVELGQNWELS